MVFNTLIGRAIIGKELAKKQGIEDPAEQLRLGLLGGLIGSPTIGLVATTAIARQQAQKEPSVPDDDTTIKEVKVPDLKAIGSFDKAKQELESVGLKAKEIGVYSSSDPEGTIVGQNPEANTFVVKATSVKVKVSRGAVTSAPSAIMPLVQGKSLEEAKKEILVAGGGNIAETDISIVYGLAQGSAQPHEVIMQNPDPGSAIGAGTKPTLMVVGAVTVPPLKGMSLGEALLRLTSIQLVPEVVADHGSSHETGVSKGNNLVVHDQEPADGQTVPMFSKVKLMVKSYASQAR